jgi:sigma-E factor negative regulatory protein RseC
MDSSNCIEQKGIIEAIDTGVARVLITSFSACAGCHSKSACGMAESADKQVHVSVGSDSQFRTGEHVKISMKKTMGWKAAILAYFVPFTLVIITLLTLTSFNYHEVVAGIGSLGILAPYFFILYLVRHRLQATFSFSLRKDT